MYGWVKLHRILLEKAIWIKSNAKQRAILITLLLMANHEQNEWDWQGKRFKVQSGQFVTSLENIAKKAGSDIGMQNVRTAIERFRKLGFLTNESTKTGRLITIVNWQSYQSTEKNQQSLQQTPNKDLTTNKKDKNERNILFTKPAIEEIKIYCSEQKNNISAEKFFDYYEANGWMLGKCKMKDWKAAVRSWEKNDLNFNFAQKEVSPEDVALTIKKLAFDSPEEALRRMQAS